MAWKRLPGSQRRYQNTETGATLSDRQYRALRKAAEEYKPFTPQRLAQQRAAQARYNALIADVTAAELEATQIRLDEIRQQIADGEIDVREGLKLFRETKKKSSGIKRRAIQSDRVKEAIKVLKRRGNTLENRLAKAEALTFLRQKTGQSEAQLYLKHAIKINYNAAYRRYNPRNVRTPSFL